MPESILKRDSKTSKQKIFVIQVTRALIDDGGLTLSDGIILDLLPMPKYRLDSLDYDDFEPIFDKEVNNELMPEQLEAPIAVFMNSSGKLSRKTLNKIEVFDDINRTDLSLLDCAILDVWANNDSFFGIRRINQKYNYKNVGKFILNFLTICDYVSGLEESLLLKEEDILKIIDHEVMAHAIEIEIKKRLRKDCNVPMNIDEEMSILTII